MSLRVGWNFGSTAEDECQDVVMQDPPCWTATNAVLKAGRGLSSWLFSNLSPPSSPSFSSFFCKESFAPLQPVYTSSSCSSQVSPSTPSFSNLIPSFINDLPRELIEEIFLEYLHGSTATSPSPNPLRGSFRRILTATGAKTTPITLAHVCSSWRAIVMSSPSLWSRLCAFRPEPSDIPLLELWLVLSTHHPLDFSITQRFKMDGGPFDTSTQHVLTLSLSHCHRWQRVSLRLHQDMEGFVTRQLRGVSLPLLESFDLNLFDWTEGGSQCISQLLSSAPNVQGGGWGFRSSNPTTFAVVDWAPLSAVQLGHAKLQDLLTILPQMASVQTLSIGTLDASDIPFAPSQISYHQSYIQLPHLTTLSFGSYNSLSDLFEHIVTPLLATLVLNSGLTDHDPMDRLFERSGCRLLALEWCDSSTSDEDLLRILQRPPLTDIRHLGIGSRISNAFVEGLTTGRGTLILGSLLSLELENCEANLTVLERMASSRPALQSVGILSDGRRHTFRGGIQVEGVSDREL